MRAAAAALPPADAKWGSGTVYICNPATRGAHVVFAEPRFSDALATFETLDGAL
jgi:hypothetical protein